MCVYNFHDCKLWEFLTQAPSKWLQCPGHTPTLCKWWAPCPLPDSLYSLLHQPPPPTLSLLPTTSFSPSTLFPSGFCSPCSQQNQEIACSLCLASPLNKHCPGQVASLTLLLQQHSSHPSTDLSAWLPPPERGRWKKAWQHERIWLALLSVAGNEHRCQWLLLSPTEICCSKLLLLYTPLLRPIPLGCCRVRVFSPPPVFPFTFTILLY